MQSDRSLVQISLRVGGPFKLKEKNSEGESQLDSLKI